MTFSVAGRCARTGMLGVAITTSSICVASRCPWVRAGVGAVATQNITDPSLGTTLLDQLELGLGAPRALQHVTQDRPGIEYRQLTVVDACGATADFTGSHTLGTNAVASGGGCVAAGNLLANTGIPQAMVDRFAGSSNEHLAARLLASLEAGLAAGGELGPVKSCGLLVAHEQPWPLVDLRVDWDDDAPLPRLRRLWESYEPQMNDYVTRALNPAAAPSYGVPGDE
ncbi:MAG: DUF1028 domain-containing protein [Gammaproteobacteria bacterium]